MLIELIFFGFNNFSSPTEDCDYKYRNIDPRYSCTSKEYIKCDNIDTLNDSTEFKRKGKTYISCFVDFKKGDKNSLNTCTEIAKKCNKGK